MQGEDDDLNSEDGSMVTASVDDADKEDEADKEQG